MPTKLDAIDKKILRVLADDGRCANNELAERVGLSPSPCLRRVRSLQDDGVISRYSAVIDPVALGWTVTAFIRVWMTGENEGQASAITAALERLPQVMDVYVVAGDCDFLLRVIAQNLTELRTFQTQHLTTIAGVHRFKTDIAMVRVKSTQTPPL